MKPQKTKWSALLALSIACLSADPALSAETDKKQKSVNENDIEEVIVTANRREETAQDVSGVVQSLDQDAMRKDGINNVKQLQLAIPGMSVANQEGNMEIYIRGVGSANNTELGDPATAPHINGVYIPRPRGLGGMYYDLERLEVNKGPQGTLYGRNALAGTLNIITAKPNFDEVEGYVQAEVGNRSNKAAEGAINLPIGDKNAFRFAGFYRDTDAGFENVGDQSLDPAGLQEDTGFRFSFASEPIEPLSIFLMFDYGHEEGTGYPGANIYSAISDTGLRPEDLDLRKVAYRGQQGEMENDLWGVQSKITYDFGPLAVEYSGSFRKVDFYQRNASNDGIAYPGRDLSTLDTDVYSTQFWEQISESQIHELRLVSSTDHMVEWSTGLFYFEEDQQSSFFSMADKGYCCYSGTEFIMPEVKGESFAAYGDLTLKLTDSFRVFGGLRYTDEEKSRYGIGGNWALTLGGEDFACCFATRLGTEGFEPALLDRPNFDVSEIDTPQEMAQFLVEGIRTPGARDTLIDQIGPIADGSNPNGNCFERDDIDNGFVTCADGSNPDTAYANGGFTYANMTIPGQQDGSSSFNFVDWRLGFELDITDDNMIYAKVSTGHKSGGFNDSFSADVVPETFRPEKLLVYEVGSRNNYELFDRPAIINATAFYYDYTDQVFQDLTCINLDPVTGECNGYSLVNRNIGESTIYGLELESVINLPLNFKWNFNASYLKSEVQSGTVADARAQDFGAGGQAPLIDLSGNSLPLQSDLNISTRLSQNFTLLSNQFDWQILVNYRSAYHLSQFNEKPVAFLDGSSQDAHEAGYPDEQEGFATVNFGLGYELADLGLRFEGFVNNLTDEEASQKSLVGSGLNLRFLNDSRTYGIRAISRF